MIDNERIDSPAARAMMDLNRREAERESSQAASQAAWRFVRNVLLTAAGAGVVYAIWRFAFWIGG